MMKQEIIEKISKYFKLTTYEAEKIYEDIFAGIIEGVKEDNIADISNLGEFIIKYNNGESVQKKTVEFLPTLSLEEEINQRSFEESRSFEPSEYTAPESNSKDEIVPSEEIKTGNTEQRPVDEPEFNSAGEKSVVEQMQSENTVEDDIRKKREGILSKIMSPKEQEKPSTDEPESNTSEFPKIAVPVFMNVKDNPVSNEETASNVTGSSEEFSETVEDKAGSFSDFFTEVKEKETAAVDSLNKTEMPRMENVIPPTAVELHNQITGEQNKNINYQSSLSDPVLKNGNGSGNGNGDNYDHKNADNSYYIWYKDSEPNTNDTQTMSYEYELLYQATKEAEYKSKLRIYVTTFILFFSVVLVLLIFSPVIYKYFFTPKETDQNTEEVQQDPAGNDESTAPSTDNQASVNSLEGNNQNNANVTPSTDQGNTNTTQQEPPKQEQPKQEPPKQEQPKQEEQKKEQQPVEQNTIAGVSKNSVGWKDDANGVIYVQLDNGKFSIQESAWDSEAKANKRISVVEKIIRGLKGTVVKSDLGAKGIWYRTRFGEFSTLQDAKSKADELRSKEKLKLQALLLTIFLYT